MSGAMTWLNNLINSAGNYSNQTLANEAAKAKAQTSAEVAKTALAAQLAATANQIKQNNLTAQQNAAIAAAAARKAKTIKTLALVGGLGVVYIIFTRKHKRGRR